MSNSNSALKVKIIISTTRPNRFGDKPAEWIKGLAEEQPGWEVELLDLRDWQMPFFNEDHSLAMKPGVYADTTAEKWSKKIAEADAFIIVTAEYNHGYPAVLKNALDYAYQEWNNKPVGFVAYGSVGGARAVEQLRQSVIELQMAPIRNSVNIAAHWNLLEENGNLKSGALDSYNNSAQGMLKQLDWWGKALKTAREK